MQLEGLQKHWALYKENLSPGKKWVAFTNLSY